MPRFLASFCLLLCLACQATSQDQPPAPLQVQAADMQNLLLRKVAPIYPPLARQARIQGTVILNIVINKSGEVHDIQLFSGHPMLAPAAIEAVKQWRYQPYSKDGEPVEVQTTVQVNFKLADKPAAKGPAGDDPSVVLPPSGGLVPQRIRVSQAVIAGLVVSKVPPQYPPDARDQHIQGTVLLKVNIDKQGNVYEVQLISGHPLLAPAAMEAVRQWKYRQYLINGNPVEVESQVQVNFTLAGD